MLRLCLVLPLIAWSLPAWGASVSLEELIVRALTEHPSLIAAQETAKSQHARTQAGKSPYWPQISLNSGISQTTAISQAQNTNEPFNLTSGSLVLRQQLFDFGKTQEDVAALAAQEEISRHQLNAQEIEVAYQIRRAYLEWLKQTGLEKQAKVRFDNQKHLYDQAKALWESGRRAKIDVTRADASLQQAQANLMNVRAQTEAALVSLMGALGDSDQLRAAPQWPAIPEVTQLSLSQLEERAARHPALLAAQSRVARAEAIRRGAEKNGLPTLSADANYGIRARNLIPNQNWSAGLSLNQPIFNGFRDQHEADEASAQERAAIAEFQAQVMKVRADLRRAHVLLDGAKRRLPASESLIKSAEANLKLAEGRYQAGVGSIIEVSDAQATLASAEADWVQAQVDVHLAIADLWRAIGETGVSP